MKLRRIVSCMMALLLASSLPLAAFAEEYDLSVGSVEVNASESGQTVSQVNGVQNHTETTPTVIKQTGSGTTSNTITINADAGATANVTIQDVNIVISPPFDDTNYKDQAAVTIDVADNATANVTLDGVKIDTENTGGAWIPSAPQNQSITSGYAAVQITGNGDVTLELDGENAVQSGFNRAGVEKNTTDDSGKGELTITDENGTAGSLNATGGHCGAGIGGGSQGNGSNITVSGDAQVKSQGGNSNRVNDNYFGAGAAIGDGGKYSDNSSDYIVGEEKAPDTASLNEGWVATYAPGTTDLDTADPNTLTYKGENGVTTSTNVQFVPAKDPTCEDDGNTAGFQTESDQIDIVTIPATGHSFTNYISDNNATYDTDGTKTAKCDHCDATHTIPDPGSKLVRQETAQTAPLYRVIGQDGKTLACKKQQKEGVLTITVDADFATLTGSLGGMKTLKAQGVDTIVFATNGATSTFAIADLLAQGSSTDTYALTHVGSTVTLTLGNGIDISSILK